MSRAVSIVVSVLLSAQIVADIDDTQQQQQDANYGCSNNQNISPFPTHFLGRQYFLRAWFYATFLFFSVWWMDDSLHSKTEKENETRIEENLCVHTGVTDYLRKNDFALLWTVSTDLLIFQINILVNFWKFGFWTIFRQLTMKRKIKIWAHNTHFLVSKFSSVCFGFRSARMSLLALPMFTTNWWSNIWDAMRIVLLSGCERERDFHKKYRKYVERHDCARSARNLHDDRRPTDVLCLVLKESFSLSLSLLFALQAFLYFMRSYLCIYTLRV